MKEMVGGCCVCSDERGWPENPLVYCDGQNCAVAVHQACYGIVTVPSGPWFCRKCEIHERSARVRCELCPSRDGALKKTDNQGWAHVVCALYIPEVRFGNVTTMEPIILQLIPQERYAKTCYICQDIGKPNRAVVGACMQCNKSNCKQQFHVTCAQSLGLLCEEAGNYLDNVKYCGYCQHHYSKLKKGGNVKTIPPYKPVSHDASSDSGSSSEKDDSTVNATASSTSATSIKITTNIAAASSSSSAGVTSSKQRKSTISKQSNSATAALAAVGLTHSGGSASLNTSSISATNTVNVNISNSNNSSVFNTNSNAAGSSTVIGGGGAGTSSSSNTKTSSSSGSYRDKDKHSKVGGKFSSSNKDKDKEGSSSSSSSREAKEKSSKTSKHKDFSSSVTPAAATTASNLVSSGAAASSGSNNTLNNNLNISNNPASTSAVSSSNSSNTLKETTNSKLTTSLSAANSSSFPTEASNISISTNNNAFSAPSHSDNSSTNAQTALATTATVNTTTASSTTSISLSASLSKGSGNNNSATSFAKKRKADSKTTLNSISDDINNPFRDIIKDVTVTLTPLTDFEKEIEKSSKKQKTELSPPTHQSGGSNEASYIPTASIQPVSAAPASSTTGAANSSNSATNSTSHKHQAQIDSTKASNLNNNLAVNASNSLKASAATTTTTAANTANAPSLYVSVPLSTANVPGIQLPATSVAADHQAPPSQSTRGSVGSQNNSNNTTPASLITPQAGNTRVHQSPAHSEQGFNANAAAVSAALHGVIHQSGKSPTANLTATTTESGNLKISFDKQSSRVSQLQQQEQDAAPVRRSRTPDSGVFSVSSFNISNASTASSSSNGGGLKFSYEAQPGTTGASPSLETTNAAIKDSPPSSPGSEAGSVRKRGRKPKDALCLSAIVSSAATIATANDLKDVKVFQNGSGIGAAAAASSANAAAHMLGNQINPNSSVAQKLSDQLHMEIQDHSIYARESVTTQFAGIPFPGKLRSSSAASSTPAAPPTGSSGDNALASMFGGGVNGTIPQTLEQLLERQWEQGSQFLMEQAQHFDIATLLSCLHQLQSENVRLEEHVTNLIARRDHLLAVNARLAIPLNSNTTQSQATNSSNSAQITATSSASSSTTAITTGTHTTATSTSNVTASTTIANASLLATAATTSISTTTNSSRQSSMPSASAVSSGGQQRHNQTQQQHLAATSLPTMENGIDFRQASVGGTAMTAHQQQQIIPNTIRHPNAHANFNSSTSASSSLATSHTVGNMHSSSLATSSAASSSSSRQQQHQQQQHAQQHSQHHLSSHHQALQHFHHQTASSSSAHHHQQQSHLHSHHEHSSTPSSASSSTAMSRGYATSNTNNNPGRGGSTNSNIIGRGVIGDVGGNRVIQVAESNSSVVASSVYHSLYSHQSLLRRDDNLAKPS